MKLRLLAVIGLIVIGVGAIAVAVIGPNFGSSSTTQYLTATATQENVTATAVATGNVAPSATYGLAFGSQPQLVTSTLLGSSGTTTSAGSSSNWLVKTVNVTVGQSVKKGAVLAVASSSSVTATLATAKASLAVAKAKLAADQAGLDPTDRAAAALSIQQAQQSLAQAQQTAPISSASAKLQLSQAQTTLTNAQNQLATDTAAGPAATGLTADENAINAAQSKLDALNLTIASAQAAVSSTASLNVQLLQAQATLTAAQNKLAADQSMS